MANNKEKKPDNQAVGPTQETASKWMWAVLVVLCLAVVTLGAFWSFFAPDSPKDKPSISQITMPSSPEKPIDSPKETINKGKRFLIFSLLGGLLLAVAFIPKLPAKGLIGSAGALLLLFGSIMWAASIVWPGTEVSPRARQASHEQKIFTQKAANDFPATDDSGQPVILEPGERLVVTKDEEEPAATLIFRSGSNERFLPTDRWSTRGTTYTHTGQYANEPVRVYYSGTGHYRFQKTNGAAQSLAVPINQNKQAQCLLDEKFGKKNAE